MKFALILIGATFLISCGNNSSSTSGSMSIVFTSSTLATRAASRAGTACSVTTEIGGSEGGLCYTPLSVSGYFNQANLSKTGGGAPVRILGGGTTAGLEGVFKKSAFDLKTSPTIASGDDNIQDGGGTYDILSLTTQGLEVRFTAEATPKYYHVRIPFATTPPSNNAAFASCGLGGGLTTADTLGTLYGTVAAQAGDILVCIKSTSTETCADTDFQWVNSSGALASTRPSSPKALTGAYAMTADACTAGGSDHPEITWGNLNMDILLSSSISVSAAIAGGVKTYTSGSSSGTKLTVNLDISTTSSLFVPTSAFATDLNATLQTDILNNIEKILFKPVYIKNRKNTATSGTGDLTATATLTIAP